MTDLALGELHSALCEAMVAGDLAELAAIVAEDFTLTHMTGYVQARRLGHHPHRRINLVTPQRI